jgi:hypothetical protein
MHILKGQKDLKKAKPKTSRRRQIIKIRAEINEINFILNKIQRINKTKPGSLKKYIRLTCL